MKKSFGKRPYEAPAFKSYGTITGVTQMSGSPTSALLDDAMNDGGTPGGVIDPNDPLADSHNGDTQISD